MNEEEKTRLIALVSAAQKDDEEAPSGLIDVMQSRLFRFCFYLCSDRQLAEDICQDAFVRAFDQIRTLKDPATFSSWLFRIAKNIFLDHKRRAHLRRELPEEICDEACAEQGEPDSVLDVRRALSTLSDDERLLLLLVDVEEYSYQEAAETLKISENALRSRVHRARKAFLALLAGKHREKHMKKG